ncbi:MAG TPA: glycosyltransferase family 2 protein [Bacillota bacterium]|nr:glycosyltransferase family 2 protein [Bacillota bacterium]
MVFSIVTPSFRNSKWLKLCIPSVADQEGVTLEHIVQDAVSDDGTLEWLPHEKRVKAFIEKDRGMYDAVNRGYRRAQGELLAYINCDEQYLPGALKKVKAFFDEHPQVDVVFGDCLVVDGQGNYLCERRALTPQLAHTWTGDSLSFLTAATFLRRRALEQRQLFFSPELRDLGDKEWALRLIQSGLKMAVLPEFVSTFAETGTNMNLGANAIRERKDFHAAAPAWARALKPAVLAHFRLRRLLAGHYSCQPHDYAIYTPDSPERRKIFHVTHPTFRWIRPEAAPVSQAS